jgi:hypothetical protein
MSSEHMHVQPRSVQEMMPVRANPDQERRRAEGWGDGSSGRTPGS